MDRPADEKQFVVQQTHVLSSPRHGDRPLSIDKNDADICQVQGNANFHESVTAAPLDAWSPISIQLYLILLVAALNATASGFDVALNCDETDALGQSIFSSINAMDQYQSYFGHKELGSATGIIFMIYTIGNMVGSLFTGPICDRFGRRAGMMTAAVLIMVGAAVQTASKSDAYLLGGRFVLGFGVSIGTSSAPTYALEIAPPQWRARIVGYYNTSDMAGRKVFYTGAMLATGVAYASSKAPGEKSFRLPLGLQLIPPLFILIGAVFIPESPRWLTMRGKKERAAAILAKYHGGGDPEHPMVKLELREFEASIELQRSFGVWNYWGLVNTRNARWRFAMMAFMSIFAQLSGNSVLTYYLPSMYKLLGIHTPRRRLLLTFANTIVSGAGAVVGSALNDFIGRRTKLWLGSIVLAGLFAGVTGFSSHFEGGKTNASSNITNGGVAFIFLFGCAYSFIYTPLTATYCAEVLSTPMRAKGMGIPQHVILSNCANLYNTYVTAVALQAIDYRYYYVFVGLNLVYAAVWYVFGVETSGRTLEEMEEVFSAKFPPRAALQKTVVVRQSDGHLTNISSGGC